MDYDTKVTLANLFLTLNENKKSLMNTEDILDELDGGSIWDNIQMAMEVLRGIATTAEE